jgi:hypothetical protein
MNEEEEILGAELELGDYAPIGSDIGWNFDAMKKIKKDLPEFFSEWLKNGRNATKAYKKLKPNVTDASARVLGCRRLKYIDVGAIAAAYGLDYEIYFEELKNGIGAMRRDKRTDELEPDFIVRARYLKELGKILGTGKD